MLENIGGYSVDKAKFVMELYPHELDEWKAEFVLAAANTVGPRYGKSYNVASLKRGKVEGTYLYVFDVWGEAAQDIDGLDFEKWYPYLDRLDLKKPVPMTPDGQQELFRYLSDKLGSSRSLGWQSSPIRQKRGNRDAGGKTLALGSHKSDWRTLWNLRGDEDGYQEFMSQGDKLGVYKSNLHYCMYHPAEGPEIPSWQGLCRRILVGCEVQLWNVTGLSDPQLQRILAGSITAHETVEQELAFLERQIDRLPRQAVMSLLDTLNRRVFGDELPWQGYTITEDDVPDEPNEEI